MKKTTKTAKTARKPRLRTFSIWLANKTDRRDDDSIRVKAHDKEEAERNADGKYDKTRFYIRAVLTLAEARQNWYG
jgi:hypothetical protein